MVIPAALSTLLLAAACLSAAGVATPGPLSATPQALTATTSVSQALALSGTARSLVPLSATPQTLTATAAHDLPLLPKRPPEPKLEKAVPWEYFTVVTLLSAPFTALWSGLIFGIVEVAAQGGKLPPKFSSSDYAVVGAVAGSASVGIGLFSLSWGGQGAPQPLSVTVRAGASPTPVPTPIPLLTRHG
jgi:hypothetical protein